MRKILLTCCLCLLASTAHAAIQVFASRGTTAGTTTVSYTNPLAVRTWETQQFRGTTVIAAAGTLRNLIVSTPTAPGSGTNCVYDLMVDTGGGMATSGITVTIADTATTTTDSTHSLSVSAGDKITLRRTSNSSPTLGDTVVSLEFEGSTANESLYGFAGNTSVSASAARYNTVWAGDTAWSTTSSQSVSAAAGTVASYRVILDVAPASGKSYLFILTKNGTDQDGTGGTPDTSLTVANTAVSGSASFSLTVAAGDLIGVKVTPSGTPTASRVGGGFRFVSTVDGESQFFGMQGGTPSQAATHYQIPANTNIGIATSATESARDVIGGLTTFTLKNMQMVITAAPGASKSFAWSIRKNGTSPGGTPTVTISGASATTGSDSGSVSIASGNTFALQSVPTGSPASTIPTWCLVQYTGTAIAAVIRGPLVGVLP